jgi:hypothetical protein
VWRDAGKADSFDSAQTYYYLPLSGFMFQSQYGYGNSVKELIGDLKESGLPALQFGTIYGVRKGDIEFIKTQKNWINLESKVVDTLTKVTTVELTQLAMNAVDKSPVVMYNNVKVDDRSPFAIVTNKIKGAKKVSFNKGSLAQLYRRYAPKVNIDYNTIETALVTEVQAIEQRYPLLNTLTSSANFYAVAEYIEMIDAKKGI